MPYPMVNDAGELFGAPLAHLDDRYRHAVTPQMFGAKADGVADDTSAAIAAITRAQALNTVVFWPQGTYAVTANLDNFWMVKHAGTGVLTRGGDYHYITPRRENAGWQTSKVWVDGLNGVDSTPRDGLFRESALRTLEWVDMRILAKLGARALEGQWVVRITNNQPKGRWFKNTTVFGNPLEFVGDDLVNGSPVTEIIYDSAAGNHMGMWFEAGQNIHIRNLRFRGFKVGFNGYGVGAKGLCDFNVTDCEAVDCDTGFAHINNVTGSFTRCKATGCQNGFRAQYQTSTTWQYCVAQGNVRGYFLSRNSVAHLDYSEAIDSSLHGCFIDMAARCQIMESHFKRNGVGVQVEGAGEWGDDNSKFYIGTADANAVTFIHYGVGRETRTHSQTGVNEWRKHANTAVRSFAQSAGAQQTIDEDWRAGLKAGYFGDSTKRIRIKVWGRATVASGRVRIGYYLKNTTSNTSTYLLGSDMVTVGTGSFVSELTIVPESFTQQRLSLMTTDQAGARFVLGASALDASGPLQVQTVVAFNATGNSAEIHGYEVYISG